MGQTFSQAGIGKHLHSHAVRPKVEKHRITHEETGVDAQNQEAWEEEGSEPRSSSGGRGLSRKEQGGEEAGGKVSTVSREMKPMSKDPAANRAPQGPHEGLRRGSDGEATGYRRGHSSKKFSTGKLAPVAVEEAAEEGVVDWWMEEEEEQRTEEVEEETVAEGGEEEAVREQQSQDE